MTANDIISKAVTNVGGLIIDISNEFNTECKKVIINYFGEEIIIKVSFMELMQNDLYQLISLVEYKMGRLLNG